MRLGRKPSSSVTAWTQQQRVVLISLIGANVGAFVAQLVLDSYQNGFVSTYLGLSGAGVENAYAWQFFTAMFMHLGPWHFAANIAALYLLGRDVESIIGQRSFLFLYFTGAIAGELGHIFLMPATSVLYGASGGTAAVLIAYATILPELELNGIAVVLPFRFKAKHLALLTVALGCVLVLAARNGEMMHSALPAGCATGWIYAHLLGFGRPSFLQRALHQRKLNAERYRHMNAEQFIAEEVDPLLEKIARTGLQSLTRRERRTLVRAREKLVEQA